MARTYDAVVAPGGAASRARSTGQPASPRGKVLVNSGGAGENTANNRKKIPLIHTPLWSDGSYSNDHALWIGGGASGAAAQPATVGASIPYN